MNRIASTIILLAMAFTAHATDPVSPGTGTPYNWPAARYKYIWLADPGSSSAVLISPTTWAAVVAGSEAAGDGTLIIENNTLKPPASDTNGSVIISPNGTGEVSIASDASTTGTFTAAEVFATTGTFTDLIFSGVLTGNIEADGLVLPFDDTYAAADTTPAFAVSITGAGDESAALYGSGGTASVGVYGVGTGGAALRGASFGAGNALSLTSSAAGTGETALIANAGTGLPLRAYSGSGVGAILTRAGDWRTSGTVIAAGGVSSTTGTFTGALTAATLDTGQGANELYDMDQNVLTTSAPTFATVNTGQGANELYDMNQNVQTSDAVQFNSLNINSSAATINNAGTLTGPSSVYSFSSAGAGVMASAQINGVALATSDIKSSTTLTSQATRWLPIVAAAYPNGPAGGIVGWRVEPAAATCLTVLDTADSDLYLPVPVGLLAGSKISRIRTKWGTADSAVGISMELVKRDESATGSAWTTIGASQSYTGVTAVTVQTYDPTDETIVDGYAYAIHLRPLSDGADSPIQLYSVSVETTVRVY